MARYWDGRANYPVRPHRLDGRLVLSLTSHPARFATLPLTLQSLLVQSVKPDIVVLWLGEEHRDAVPEEVWALESEGLTVRFTEDRGPYTKLLPALEAWPDAHFVTADDDVYYWRHWLDELIAGHVAGRLETRCHRAWRIVLESDGTAAPYARWRRQTPNWRPSPLVFPTGVGGVFYPSGILPPETLDFDLISKLCPKADDIWFYFMTRRAGATARRVGRSRRFAAWQGTNKGSLSSGNVADNGNDACLARMQAHFGPIGALAPAVVEAGQNQGI